MENAIKPYTITRDRFYTAAMAVHPRLCRHSTMHCRVQALKALCEIRLEKDDIVSQMEDAIKPCKATRQQAKLTGVWPTLDTFRREPLGEDSSGLTYYYFDLHLCPEGELLAVLWPPLCIYTLRPLARLLSLPLEQCTRKMTLSMCRT